MYTDYKKYPNLPKLPDNLDQSLERLRNNKKMNNSFGKEVINSYLKLRNAELKEFKQKENFEMLTYGYKGFKLKMVEVDDDGLSVYTPNDLKLVELKIGGYH